MSSILMFNELKKISERPKPFEFYTASDLWADEYISEQMLSFHLNKDEFYELIKKKILEL